MKNRRKKPGIKLTRAQKKKLEELTRQAKADGRHPNSAQKTIPYLSMYKDGLCRVTENYYTMGWLIGGGVLCMIVLMTALCVVSGDADEQAEAAYRHFLESGGRKA